MYQSLARSCVPRTRRTLALALSLGLALVASGSTAAAAKKGHEGSGCDPARPAVAHYAGGVVAPGKRANPPIPCEAFVGTTSEAAIGRGDAARALVFYAPLLENTSPPPQNTLQGPEWVVRSRDLGASWTTLDSGARDRRPRASVDEHRPGTSRIWFVTTLPQLCGARVVTGATTTGHLAHRPVRPLPLTGRREAARGTAAAGGREAGRLPARRLLLRQQHRHRSQQPVVLQVARRRPHVQLHRRLSRSPPAAGLRRSAIRRGRAWWGTTGALLPDHLCGALGVAISRDEGADLAVPADRSAPGWRTSTRPARAVDRHGDLYFAYRGPGALPYLTISTDHGASWRPPMMVAAPGVSAVRRVAVAVRKRGEVALAYLGTTDGAHFNGYITESRNVLRRRPRFWSASVNDPAHPLVNAADSETFGDRFFYGTAAIAPDGTAWAGFHCAKTSACPGPRIGVVGRLARSSRG